MVPGHDRGATEILLCGWGEQPLLQLGLALGRTFLDRGMMVQVQPSFGNVRPGAPGWVAVRVGRCYVRERGRQRPRPQRVLCLDPALTGWASRLARGGSADTAPIGIVPIDVIPTDVAPTGAVPGDAAPAGVVGGGAAGPDWLQRLIPEMLSLVEGGDSRDAGER